MVERSKRPELPPGWMDIPAEHYYEDDDSDVPARGACFMGPEGCSDRFYTPETREAVVAKLWKELERHEWVAHADAETARADATEKRLAEAEYAQLLLQWEYDTMVRSDPALEHPSYAQLVDAGAKVVPVLLRAVEKRQGWKALYALRGIYGEGPSMKDIAGKFEPICERWIAWAKAEGLSW